MSDLGVVSVLLGIKVNRNRSSGYLQLIQDHYIKSILEKFNMSHCNPTTTSADGITDTSGTPLDSAGIHRYQELVGSFIYLATCTRPDIAFAMMRLSRDLQMHACDQESGRSISGYIFTLAGAAISWSSKLQPVVAQSTIEAEYIALGDAANEAVYLDRFITQLGPFKMEIITIHEENMEPLHLASKIFSAKTKHTFGITI
ncbi:unnamed protein product [Discosporangium mesarthrocarpum]